MRSRRRQLLRYWKTEQAYRVMILLKEYHIGTKTIPDEFSGAFGNSRMLLRDPEIMWPVYVRARNFERAVAILTEEQLL